MAHLVGWYHAYLNEHTQARRWFEKALALAESLNNQPQIAYIVSSLAHSYKDEDAAVSCRYFQRARALAMLHELKLDAATLKVLNNWGFAAILWGETDEALTLLHEALDVAREHGLNDDMAYPHANLARVYLLRGDLAQAQVHYVEGLRRFRDADYQRVLRAVLLEGAELRYALGDANGAAELLGLHEGNPSIDWPDALAALIEQLESDLTPDEFAAAWERGQALDLDATVEQLIRELAAGA